MPPCLIGMEACVGAHHLSFRDAEAIAEAVQRPRMKLVATKTVDQLGLQAMHSVRERLVSQRTGIINQIRAFLLERGVAVRQGLRFLRSELPIILAEPSDVLSPRMVRIIEDLGDWHRLNERIEDLANEIEAIARQDAGCSLFSPSWLAPTKFASPLLEARKAIEQQVSELDRKVMKLARRDAQVRRFMTAPGVGPITALAFKATIDDPTRFARSRSVGAVSD